MTYNKFQSKWLVYLMAVVLVGVGLLLPTITAHAAPATLSDLLSAPLCPSVSLTSPVNNTFISHSTNQTYTWAGEPEGTARREWVAFQVELQANGSFKIGTGFHRADSAPNAHTTTISPPDGTYNWLVAFYDANDNLMCVSTTGWLDVRDGSAPSSSSDGSAGVVVVIACGNKVIVLSGSPFGGARDIDVVGDDFDASIDPTLAGLCVTIHGNNNVNILTGGSLSDLIFGYSGNDTLFGGAGNDVLNGGDESCTGVNCNTGIRGDTLRGQDGDDILNGGDESCTGTGCNSGILGDVLDGGTGNDTLNGGNESCSGTACNDGGILADVLGGGDGDDVLNGGDESCSGTACNSGVMGDVLGGQDGDDILNGGNESCSGTGCNSGVMGELISGGTGNDTLNGGNESCSGFNCNLGVLGDVLSGDANTDTLDGGTETDNGTGGGGTAQDTCTGEIITNCP